MAEIKTWIPGDLVHVICLLRRGFSVSIHHLHISHNAPYLPPRISHKHCFQFLLVRLYHPGERKNKGYAKFGGAGGEEIRCIMGDVQVAYEKGGWEEGK